MLAALDVADDVATLRGVTLLTCHHYMMLMPFLPARSGAAAADAIIDFDAAVAAAAR